MTVPTLRLTKYVPVSFVRGGQGYYDEDGYWLEPEDTTFIANCNIQPAKYSKVVQMPEADRTEMWQVVYTSSELRAKKEGENGYIGDRFEWLGDIYEVRKVKRYVMGVLDHTEAMAVRIELAQE